MQHGGGICVSCNAATRQTDCAERVKNGGDGIGKRADGNDVKAFLGKPRQRAYINGLANFNELVNLPSPTSSAVVRLYIFGLHNVTLSGLPELPKLTELEISSINGLASLSGLPELPALEKLRIDSNHKLVSLSGLPALSKLTSLVAINRDGALSRELPTVIASLQSMKKLALQGNDAAKALFAAAHLRELEDVLLEDTADLRTATVQMRTARDALPEPTIRWCPTDGDILRCVYVREVGRILHEVFMGGSF